MALLLAHPPGPPRGLIDIYFGEAPASICIWMEKSCGLRPRLVCVRGARLSSLYDAECRSYGPAYTKQSKNKKGDPTGDHMRTRDASSRFNHRRRLRRRHRAGSRFLVTVQVQSQAPKGAAWPRTVLPRGQDLECAPLKSHDEEQKSIPPWPAALQQLPSIRYVWVVHVLVDEKVAHS